MEKCIFSQKKHENFAVLWGGGMMKQNCSTGCYGSQKQASDVLGMVVLIEVMYLFLQFPNLIFSYLYFPPPPSSTILGK